MKIDECKCGCVLTSLPVWQPSLKQALNDTHMLMCWADVCVFVMWFDGMKLFCMTCCVTVSACNSVWHRSLIFIISHHMRHDWPYLTFTRTLITAQRHDQWTREASQTLHTVWHTHKSFIVMSVCVQIQCTHHTLNTIQYTFTDIQHNIHKNVKNFASKHTHTTDLSHTHTPLQCVFGD